nr:MAG TPA: hypothetical protein [Caudoviricetes sp.]
MKIERNGKLIKVAADKDKSLYFNHSFCKMIYSQNLDTSAIKEYEDAELTEVGKVWYAPEGMYYMNAETEEDKGAIVVITEGDDIRNYMLMERVDE